MSGGDADLERAHLQAALRVCLYGLVKDRPERLGVAFEAFADALGEVTAQVERERGPRVAEDGAGDDRLF